MVERSSNSAETACSPSVQQAAADIQALINSRVSSPRIGEIAAIVAKVASGAAAPSEEDTSTCGMTAVAHAVAQTLQTVLDYDDMDRGERERFTCYEDAAAEHQYKLEALLLRFEPRTPTEVLTLAFALEIEVEALIADASWIFSPVQPVRAVGYEQRLERRLETVASAYSALIRGLMFRLGLQSPLSGMCAKLSPGGINRSTDRPQPDLAELEEEAQRLLAQKVVTLAECRALGRCDRTNPLA